MIKNPLILLFYFLQNNHKNKFFAVNTFLYAFFIPTIQKRFFNLLCQIVTYVSVSY